MKRERAPNGVSSNAPIALRMLPKELERVRALAARENRPVANMCRVLVLHAMTQVEQANSA